LDDWDYFCRCALEAHKIITVTGIAYTWRHHGGVRATDCDTLTHARAHHQILRKIEHRLRETGDLTSPRQRRLAQYFYKELRVLALNDPVAAEAALDHISALDPRFTPRDEEPSVIVRITARIVGVQNMLRIYRIAKTITEGLTRPARTLSHWSGQCHWPLRL
jgi:hypothetical protein